MTPYIVFLVYIVQICAKLLLVCGVFMGLMVLFAANLVHSVLFLISCFVCFSLVFVIFGAEFIGLTFIIVYVGAIAVLFLFVVMLLDLRTSALDKPMKFGEAVACTGLVIGLTEFVFMDICMPVENLNRFLGDRDLAEDYTKRTYDFIDISTALYNDYAYYLVFIGALLFCVSIGIVLVLEDTLTLSKGRNILQRRSSSASNKDIAIADPYCTLQRYNVNKNMKPREK